MNTVKLSTIISLISLCTVSLVHAQVLESCERWGNYAEGNYVVYNNLWGENVGKQCITASSTTKWTVTSKQTGGGVKTYPNSSFEPVGVPISSLKSLTSSMDVSCPTSGDFCTAWDIWAPEEIMIWINKYGSVSPWGVFVETATIGGVSWDVYAPNGPGNGYPGFVRKSNTNSTTVDLKSILDFCVKKGWLKNSGIIEKVQGGFEITATNGEQTFKMNSYSVAIDSDQPLEKPSKPAPPSEIPTVGNSYKILAAHSSKVLTVDNKSTSAGANVIHSADENGSHQEWLLEAAGATGQGFYKLTNKNSGMVLEVQDWSTADDGNIRQGSFKDSQNNQQWEFKKEGDYYQIINRNSQKLIDVAGNSKNNGANIHQWSYFGVDAFNQKWSFKRVGGTPVISTKIQTPPRMIDLDDGTSYSISGKTLDSKALPSKGIVIRTHGKNGVKRIFVNNKNSISDK